MRILSSFLLCLCITICLPADVKTCSTDINITGKVIDADGNVITGAAVQAYQIDFSGGQLNMKLKLLDEMQTKSDGKYSLALPLEMKGKSYAFGMIVASKDELALGWGNWQVSVNGKLQTPSNMTLQLEKAAVIAGKVVDDQGKPIAKAQVQILVQKNAGNHNKQYLMGAEQIKGTVVESNQQGIFEFNIVPAEQGVFAGFILTATGFAQTMFLGGSTQFYDPSFKPGQKDIKITLPREAVIEGKVLDAASGKGVSDVDIVAQMHSPGKGMYREKCVSGENGKFRFSNLQEGLYILNIKIDKKPAQWVAKPVKVNTVAGKTNEDVNIELEKGGFLEITVIDSKTKQPISDARVNVHEYFAQTDKNGVAKIHLLPIEKNVNYSAMKQGYNHVQKNDSIKIVKNETTKKTIELTKAPTYSGVVVYPDGKPAANVEVDLLPNHFNSKITTSSNGQFVIVSGKHFYRDDEETQSFLLARDKKRNMAALYELNDTGQNNLKIKLKPGCTVICKITDSEKKPIAQANGHLMMWVGRYGVTVDQSKSDSNGMINMSALPSYERYRLSVSADKYGQNEQEIELDNAENPLVTDACLPIANLSMAGVVLDEEEKPVPNAQVNINGRNQQYKQCKTDKKGRFEFKNIVAGSCYIYCHVQSGNDYKFASTTAEGGDKNIRLVLGQSSSPEITDSRVKPKSMLGKPIKNLTDFGLPPAEELAKGKKIMLCFWDLNQRPSRHMITMLSKQADALKKKNVVVVIVHASDIPKDKLNDWLQQHNIRFPSGCIKTEQRKADRIISQWGAKHLPWVILTDNKHIVTSEGTAKELD